MGKREVTAFSEHRWLSFNKQSLIFVGCLIRCGQVKQIEGRVNQIQISPVIGSDTIFVFVLKIEVMTKHKSAIRQHSMKLWVYSVENKLQSIQYSV